ARFSFNRVAPVSHGTYPDVPPELRSMGPYSKVGPQMSPGSGITAWAGWNWVNDWWITNRFTFKNDVNRNLGSHTLQFGGEVERTQLNLNDPNRPMGDWNFGSLADFLAGKPNRGLGSVTPLHGSPVRGHRQWLFGLYLQDDWQVRPGLILNLGVRWDPYTVPTEVNGITGNLVRLEDPYTTIGPLWENKSWGDIAPRIGLAWSPFASGRTSIRAGFGMFYIPHDTASYRWNTARVTPDPRRPDVPLYWVNRYSNIDAKLFPDLLAVINSAKLTSFGETQVFAHNDFVSQHALQSNFQIQQQLGDSNMVSAGYSFSRGLNLLWGANINIPQPVYNGTSLELPADTKLINPAWEQITQYAPASDSWYNAFTFAFARKFSAGLQGQVAYTFSKTTSSADHHISSDPAGGGGSHKSAYVMEASKGLSSNDLPHVLQVSYSYELPLGRDLSGVASALVSGWQLQGIITAQVGQPFSLSRSAPSFLSRLSASGLTPNLKPGFSQDTITWGSPNVSADPTGRGRYFNPDAYSLPGVRELGNVGRNTLRGPGLATWDFTLSKNFQLREQTRLQFRAEMFNALNRPNFALPRASLFAGGGGPVGSAGVISSTIGTARQVQLALKLTF
ncbi:MAG: TonB-dependent receptor, partial [Acidobacteria bacterium]|nr:TonB-dependent receptor [Acidobacteriota bacterium]